MKNFIIWYLVGVIVSTLTVGIFQDWKFRKIDMFMIPTFGAVCWPVVVAVAGIQIIDNSEHFNEVVLDLSDNNVNGNVESNNQ